jgi:hypothetical protein
VALASMATATDFGHFHRSGELSADTFSSRGQRDSDRDRVEGNGREQERIELAVQEALLKVGVPTFPQQPTFRAKSYQLSFTTVYAHWQNDSVLNFRTLPTGVPTFGPVAIIATTSPGEGVFGPTRVHQELTKLQNEPVPRKFGNLFAKIRQAGFFNELDLRTLVEAGGHFSINTKALLSPCFPVTDEPGLQIEVIVLIQNTLVIGTLRKKWLAIDRFFDSNRNFVPSFVEGLMVSRFNTVSGRYDVSPQTVALLTASECTQFSYFA